MTLGTNGQTDHISVDNIGLPGFGFIQDSIDYFQRTHHSNADVYERLQADDMKESATIMAAFLWNAANMDEPLPRARQRRREEAAQGTDPSREPC